MNAAPPFARAAEPRRSPIGPAPSTSVKWAALGDAGSAVAVLAGVEAHRQSAEIRNFPALLRDVDDWRRERAENGIADLAAMMEPGLAALLAVNARGADPRPAALALLQEFNAARAALLELLPPAGTMGPSRSA